MIGPDEPAGLRDFRFFRARVTQRLRGTGRRQEHGVKPNPSRAFALESSRRLDNQVPCSRAGAAVDRSHRLRSVLILAQAAAVAFSIVWSDARAQTISAQDTRRGQSARNIRLNSPPALPFAGSSRSTSHTGTESPPPRAISSRSPSSSRAWISPRPSWHRMAARSSRWMRWTTSSAQRSSWRSWMWPDAMKFACGRQPTRAPAVATRRA